MKTSQQNIILSDLLLQGFDTSKILGRSVMVGCSECQALAINGHPCHENGCRNTVCECKGCNNSVPRRGNYCEECQ